MDYEHKSFWPPIKKYWLSFFLITTSLLILGAGCESSAEQLATSTSPEAQNDFSVTSTEVAQPFTDPEADIKNFLSYIDVNAAAITKGDINKNGITDYLVDGMPIGCGSCHSRPLYIFEGGRVILEYSGDDYQVLSTKNNVLKIREPIRVESEPLCCASRYQVTTVECPSNGEKAYCLVKNTQPETPLEPLEQPQSAPNGTYTNTYGNEVPSPYYAPSAPAGASAQCADGTYSFSQSRRGTCSHHGGVAEWY